MDLRVFESELERLIGRPSSLRPFVCDGSPLSCEAFIVGLNPATKMPKGWWTYWSAESGFRKAVWFDDYVRERAEAPLKPGKTRRQRVSATRRVIETVVSAALPIRCLETNIYAAETPSGADLGTDQRLTAPFDYLLRTIRPRVVVAHGDDAIDHLSRLTGTPITWGNEASASHGEHTFQVIAVAHFARPRAGQGWSGSRAAELGRRIRSLADRP